jgi:hypothetical protein
LLSLGTINLATDGLFTIHIISTYNNPYSAGEVVVGGVVFSVVVGVVFGVVVGGDVVVGAGVVVGLGVEGVVTVVGAAVVVSSGGTVVS